MLLSEVALGKMYECYQKNYLSAETLAAGTQSVKACGERIPDPNEQYITEDGIIIPMGHGIDATNY